MVLLPTNFPHSRESWRMGPHGRRALLPLQPWETIEEFLRETWALTAPRQSLELMKYYQVPFVL